MNNFDMKFSSYLIIFVVLIAVGVNSAYAVVTTFTDDVIINPGDLGVGTNSPTAKLHVDAGLQPHGTDAAIFLKTRSASDAVRYTFTDVGGVTTDVSGAFWRGFNLAAPFITVSDSNVFPRLTTYAEYNSLIDPTSRLWIIDASNSEGANQKHDIVYRISGTNILYMDDSGNVGIGTNSPLERLDVNGNLRLTGDIVSPNDICIGSCS